MKQHIISFWACNCLEDAVSGSGRAGLSSSHLPRPNTEYVRSLQPKAEPKLPGASFRNAEENFEDLPLDACSDEALQEARRWQRFLHNDDEHIKAPPGPGRVGGVNHQKAPQQELASDVSIEALHISSGTSSS